MLCIYNIIIKPPLHQESSLEGVVLLRANPYWLLHHPGGSGARRSESPGCRAVEGGRSGGALLFSISQCWDLPSLPLKAKH